MQIYGIMIQWSKNLGAIEINQEWLIGFAVTAKNLYSLSSIFKIISIDHHLFGEIIRTSAQRKRSATEHNEKNKQR